jgi:tetratricopeptide (TPR) repeat protein
MPESTGQPPSSDDADPSVKPRPVSSRHFRQPGEIPPAADPAKDAQSDERSARDDEELEELTQKFKDLVGRKRPAPAADAAAEEVRVRRKPMPRSGNVNMSVIVGDPHEAPEFPAQFRETEPPTLTLPSGFVALAWKLGAVALVMFGLGYFIATIVRPAAPPAADASAAPEPPTWHASSLAVLDQALAADQAGDLKSATAILTDLAATEPNLPALMRYLANLHARQGNHVAAERELLAQINTGREVPQAYYARAFNAARQRHFDDALKYLQFSLVNDPLQADTLFQICELQRRLGKLPDAIAAGKQALLRVRPGYGISPANIGLKMRLAQIEAGQAPEVEAALAEARKTSPLAPEWWFTAAALSLQTGDLTAAAEALAKARELLPRDEFNTWVEDYFFRMYTDKPELVGIRPTDDERRRRQQASWEFSLDP